MKISLWCGDRFFFLIRQLAHTINTISRSFIMCYSTTEPEKSIPESIEVN